MKAKKVRLIIISSILVVLLVVVLCTTTLMRLKDISIEYATSCKLLSQENSEAIIRSGNFEMNKNLLFMNFDDEETAIEKATPYVDVIKIERKFPNKAIIHIVERTPVFKIHNSTFVGQYSVYDKNLKVLHVATVSQFYSATGEDKVPVLIFDSSFEHEVDLSVAAGNFLSDELLRTWMTAIADGTYNYNATLTTIMSSIKVSKTDGNYVFTINFHNSDIVATVNGDTDLQTKIKNIVTVFSECGGKYSSITSSPDGVVFGKAA